MSELEELKEQVALLRAEVAALRRETGVDRLGPRPETPEEEAARVKAIVDTLIPPMNAVGVLNPLLNPPPVDRTKLCTTDGRSPADARASQTNESGQHPSYLVLCEEERRKGFVRPYRDSYRHLTCGTVTTMGRSLCETYARDPGFYGATFCCGCNRHLPVSEFVWTADGQQVGS